MKQLIHFFNKFTTTNIYLKYACIAFGLWGIYKFLLFIYNICQYKLKLKDKTVVIIGASSGIGRALAFEFYNKV